MIIIQIAGRVGRDPESRFTTNGQKVTTISLATNIRRSNKEETVWWRVTVWGDRFDKMMPYIKKGSALIVVGELSKAPEIFTDREGKAQVGSLELTAEIIRFSPFGSPDRQNQEQQPYAGATASAPAQPQQSFGADSGFGDFTGGLAAFGATSGAGQESNGDEIPF